VKVTGLDFDTAWTARPVVTLGGVGSDSENPGQLFQGSIAMGRKKVRDLTPLSVDPYGGPANPGVWLPQDAPTIEMMEQRISDAFANLPLDGLYYGTVNPTGLKPATAVKVVIDYQTSDPNRCTFYGEAVHQGVQLHDGDLVAIVGARAVAGVWRVRDGYWDYHQDSGTLTIKVLHGKYNNGKTFSFAAA
jgi:hypothetical protein